MTSTIATKKIPTDKNGEEIPYRVVFGDEISAGTVILEECTRVVCSASATNHAPGKWHQLTVVKHRAEGDDVLAVISDEDGYQHPIQFTARRAMLYVALPPVAAQGDDC